MNERQAQETKRNKGFKRRFKLLMVILFSFIGWATMTIWNQVQVLDEKSEQLGLLEAELEETKKLNEEYNDEITRLQDSEYIEQRIRSDLQMTQEDETLLILTK
ncbi:FtsB family cell division protein [Chengkuizengella axinellae]|uniref:Septum formation initiator family protein n=1 Tax=Chengkuizengella axinellae TaxID=3064388 RepID=A0ABT9J5R1_9BACL|nr:septum formation initiator family protein [Chengkuizengella sp. 2205SS18-9]MDP5276956.1 septum formation initiator family protein [Chengkuizengella sp. 2205SS18-9]